MSALAKGQNPPLQATDRKPRILIVDDVSDNREVLARRLVRRDFEIEEASGGREALEKINAQSFDLVLLDIMMPDLSGTEVLKTVRETHSPSELPIIMVTAKSQSEDVVDSLALGANDYISKPVDFAVALARIQTHVAQKISNESTINSAKTLGERTEQLSNELRQRASALQTETEKRERSEEKLRFLAYHDTLTGLLNRQGFHDSLHVAIDEMPVNDLEPALLFIDLDGFKAVNDSFGHEVGDKLLVRVGEAIKSIAPPDSDVGRLGGDEFAVVTKFENQIEPSLKLADAIVAELSKPFDIDGRQVQIGASCGVARAGQVTSDLDGLIKAADLAMYHAKSKGIGGVVPFEAGMLSAHQERTEFENEIRLAIQNSDFEVFYQPLLDVSTGSIIAFEALLRWPHAERGLLSPEVFIPVAEQCGLIDQLGSWALRQACAEATNWPDDIRIAVNLSPLQFDSPGLLSTLVNALATTGLAPNRLEIELTESALLGFEGENLKILESIRELGVRISMDDFGTGYSSLAYLKNFRFDKIKIDKQFIQSLDTSQSDTAIVDAIVQIGKSIGISVTAEGIETEAQLASIQSHGCSEGQGYLFSRPLTAGDAQVFIKKQRTKK